MTSNKVVSQVFKNQNTNTLKVVLVTGASSGIGKAIALQLISDGLIVYVAARRMEKMRDLEELGAIALKMDITQEQDIKKVVKQIESEYDGVDILVNNAPGNASDPSVIAKVVSQAIKAKKPKTRYVAGKLAKPLILMRKWLGDRILDKIITNAVLK
jgi:short-subunit dehydrogenase